MLRKMLLTSFLIIAGLAAVNAGQIALTGSQEGQSELKYITEKILDGKTQEYSYENVGEKFPFDRLDDFTLIIAAVRFSNTPDQEQLKKLRSWIENGGNLILISTAPNSFARTPTMLDKDKLLAWAGVWKVVYKAKGINCVVQVPESPVIQGVNLKDKPQWFKADQLIWHYRNMQNIIGNEKYCLVGFAPVNAGSVAFLGYELNKLSTAHKDPEHKWLQIITNLINMSENPQYRHSRY
ncbi:hypothetical protein P0136_02685 [Lentisphaerota bacterium ZTH]|nr:hypothetical protein JYG24_06175 [Lentisphaerota bacterium]WET06908.1 hypothetical protein P0136_02685 [Lentisphaerota bacterium ZTH]